MLLVELAESTTAMGRKYVFVDRKGRRSVSEIPEGPVSDAMLTDLSFQSNVGYGRVAVT